MNPGLRLSLVVPLLAGLLAGQVTRYRDPVFPSVHVQTDIPYGSAFNPVTGQQETLLLDRYEPVGDLAGARPAVVAVHGGGFVGGSKSQATIVQICEDLAGRGYLAVSIDYRLLGQGGPGGVTAAAVEAAKEDFKAAVRFLRANEVPWRVDGSRIACIGSSAGGFTVMHGAYVPGEGMSGNLGFSSEVHVVAELWGAIADPTDMEAGEPPVLIVHGTSDPVVPYTAALAIAQRAQRVGIPYELHPLIGAGHAPWGLFFQNHFEDVVAFYYEHLELGQLSGLRARPGHASPGTLTLDAFGIAGDRRLLGASLGTAVQPVPGLGQLCLELSTLATWDPGPFPATPRLPTAGITFAVPGGLAGVTLFWQELHTEASGRLRWLTNCVATGF